MGEHARIFVVDDDKSTRKPLGAILIDEGYCADSAESGKQAIEETQRGYYDLALIDIRLPNMEGAELLTRK